MDWLTNGVYNRLNMTFNKGKLKPYYEKLKRIKSISMRDWSDARIGQFSLELRELTRNGVPLCDLLVDAGALVDEAAWRMLGYKLYDTQLLAGMALHEGHLVEMQTGEGKTLAAVLPAYLYALQGKGIHIFTFNDYLSGRDNSG